MKLVAISNAEGNFQWHLTVGLLLLTFLAVSCGGDTATGGGGAADPVNLIINGATRASATTHWDPNQWSVPGNTYAVFTDGTGLSRVSTTC